MPCVLRERMRFLELCLALLYLCLLLLLCLGCLLSLLGGGWATFDLFIGEREALLSGLTWQTRQQLLFIAERKSRQRYFVSPESRAPECAESECGFDEKGLLPGHRGWIKKFLYNRKQTHGTLENVLLMTGYNSRIVIKIFLYLPKHCSTFQSVYKNSLIHRLLREV